MSKNHKNVCTTLIHIEQFLILAFVVNRCISIFDFASLLGIPIRITSPIIGLKTCAITAGIKKYKSIIKKKTKNHYKIELLAKSKLTSVEVLISMTLIDSEISHGEFILINNVLKKCNDMKEKIKNLEP